MFNLTNGVLKKFLVQIWFMFFKSVDFTGELEDFTGVQLPLSPHFREVLILRHFPIFVSKYKGSRTSIYERFLSHMRDLNQKFTIFLAQIWLKNLSENEDFLFFFGDFVQVGKMLIRDFRKRISFILHCPAINFL